MTAAELAPHVPEDVRDGLRHMAAIFQTTQALRGVLADAARAEVDASIRWIHELSTSDLPPTAP